MVDCDIAVDPMTLPCYRLASKGSAIDLQELAWHCHDPLWHIHGVWSQFYGHPCQFLRLQWQVHAHAVQLKWITLDRYVPYWSCNEAIPWQYYRAES